MQDAFETYWQKLLKAKPALSDSGATVSMSPAQFRKALRQAFDAGLDQQGAGKNFIERLMGVLGCLLACLCLTGCTFGPAAPHHIDPSAPRLINLKAGETLIVSCSTSSTVSSTSCGPLAKGAGTVMVTAEPEPRPIPPSPPTPTPGPAPNPPAPPSPPVPDGKYGLARWVKGEVETLLKDRPTRAAEAKAVSEDVEVVASKLVAGGYRSGTEAISDLFERLQGTLGPAQPAWEPVVASVIAKVQTLALKPGMTLGDVGVALQEVSTGLGLVR